MKWQHYVLGLTLATSFSVEGGPAPTIDLADFPAAMVDDVVVPIPMETFAVLDKLGEPNWRAELRPEPSGPIRDRSQTALLLGTVVADGFIAVQARDSEQVKEVGREVLRLSESLGVRDSVTPHCAAIMDRADVGDWHQVKIELDKAQQNVRAAMAELRDEQLAQLVSLGGWLRGTEALTSIVSKNYTYEGAELLHQPDLINYFLMRIDGMPPRMRSHALVEQISVVLKDIGPMVQPAAGEEINLESVTRIHDMTKGVVQAITDREA